MCNCGGNIYLIVNIVVNNMCNCGHNIYPNPRIESYKLLHYTIKINNYLKILIGWVMI